MYKIRYASIRSLDISNGEGIGVSLFTQGCHFHCEGCFNQETWDCNDGKEWNGDVQEYFIELINRPYIERVSILGGDPLHENNLMEVELLLNKIRVLFGDSKTIWLYSGYKWEDIFPTVALDWLTIDDSLRERIVSLCDVFVDGRFVKELADVNYKWAGSTNQRVIDVRKSLERDSIVLLDKEK